jgi:hypothetical protein
MYRSTLTFSKLQVDSICLEKGATHFSKPLSSWKKYVIVERERNHILSLTPYGHLQIPAVSTF